MNKKTIIAISTILVIVLALSGATYAWLTAETNVKTNEFKPGILSTTIIENNKETDDNEILIPEDNSVEKEIKVNNDDIDNRGVDAYIRAMLVPAFRIEEGSLAGNIDLAPDDNEITIGAPDGGTITLKLASDWSTNWIYDNGYFYHKAIVPPNNLTAVLLERVEVSDTGLWDAFQLEVLSDAIQAESGAATDAWGVTISDDEIVGVD